jgi:hypothetical protein
MEVVMARIVRCGLIETQREWSPKTISLGQIQGKMIAKHEKLIASAAKGMAQILGLWELFCGPHCCAERRRPDSGAKATARQEILGTGCRTRNTIHEPRLPNHEITVIHL